MEQRQRNRNRKGEHMHGPFLFAAVIVFSLGARSPADGEIPIQSTLHGVLVRSPDAFSAEIPFLEVREPAKAEHAGPLVRLVLPGDAYVRQAVAAMIDQAVLVTGQLQIRGDVFQKDGTRRTEHAVRIAAGPGSGIALRMWSTVAVFLNR
jgi:hypothetical protein